MGLEGLALAGAPPAAPGPSPLVFPTRPPCRCRPLQALFRPPAMRCMHAHTLLAAAAVVLALASAAAQPAGPPSSPPRAPGAFQQTLTVGVGLLSEGNFPFAQKNPNATATSKQGGLEGFEVGGGRRARLAAQTGPPATSGMWEVSGACCAARGPYC